MKTITVNASKKYDVIVGNDLLSKTGSYLSKVTKPGKAAIISDSNVWPLYGATVKHSLQSSGYETVSFIFPAGEASKNSDTYIQILNFLAQSGLSRSDTVVALGGGVTGDMAGFAAATYMRGIPFIQLPTSLLAMVDSSVGGKTAIDLPAGKNLAGAFCQPILVLCDLNTLSSLPDEVFRDGCAEVIKYAILYDEKLFSHLNTHGLFFDREAVISRCIELKRDVVALDEFDRGERQKLNLGHTVGHGIEACSDYTVSHGQAVASGMAIISKSSAKYSICDIELYDKVCQVLDLFMLPKTTGYLAEAIYLAALSDKKRSGGTVNLIVPKAIGECIIRPTPVEEVKSFFEAGL